MAENREVGGDTEAHPEGLDLRIAYAAVPLRDGEGRVVGALEIVTEQTALRKNGHAPGNGDRDGGQEKRTCIAP